ncbi:hypothetical protein BcepSauron_235 [Burkholderia phage BcepSauron]|uniref:Uncharacterized protein n=2 Tax=Sarumanvirus TaxID=2843450 RepID=A0A482MLT9_9CAUD|nr:hypothetical protein H1O16_gp233 [Burkholderia phage BcepSaruman]YP_009904613.1 hypothetical protein H1O17_gp235 [Burkholderia phage BcepSauron]QBQ74615.1 hypothetical protein BcepSauron_235 [Burkholderia phage BcepSauron]QBX06646.1 hypothetical protein BcepSaruman_233 [Burkholderia phage BcepSaruman]
MTIKIVVPPSGGIEWVKKKKNVLVSDSWLPLAFAREAHIEEREEMVMVRKPTLVTLDFGADFDMEPWIELLYRYARSSMSGRSPKRDIEVEGLLLRGVYPMDNVEGSTWVCSIDMWEKA